MLYKDTKEMVDSPDGHTNISEKDTTVLQGDTLASYLFILFLDNVLRTSLGLLKENCFTSHLEKRSRGYPTKTMRNTDYVDEQALLTNKLARAQSLHSLEYAVVLHIDPSQAVKRRNAPV